MNSKAQITIFIIIGIVIVASAATVIIITTQLAEEEFEEPKIQDVPLEFQPVSNFITACLNEVSIDALELIGRQGGYIEINDPRWDIEVNPDFPTESDAVAPSNTAYWMYLQTPNTCEADCAFNDRRPLLETTDDPTQPSIEGQLEEYIAQHVKEDCIMNFEPFVEQGYQFEEITQPNVDVSILENDIAITLNYNIQVDKVGSTDLDQFFIRIPLHLRQLYELGEQLSLHQGQTRFLGEHILSLIDMYTGIDSDLLPPKLEYFFGLTATTFWSVSEVEQKIKDLLSDSIPFLQIPGTQNFNPNKIPTSQYSFMYSDWPSVNIPNFDFDRYNQISTEFSYRNYPVYFDLCNGGICQASTGGTNDYIPIPTGIHKYQALYDLSFPVHVKLHHNGDFLRGRPYYFNLMLESNIRDNRPMDGAYSPARFEFGAGETMLCDEDKKSTGDVTITIKEKDKDILIDGVTVQVSCGAIPCDDRNVEILDCTDPDDPTIQLLPEECQTVVTEVPDKICGNYLCSNYQASDTNGIIEDRFPSCFQHTLVFRKEGYEDAILQTDELLFGQEAQLEVEMLKYVEKEITVVKKVPMGKDIDTGDWLVTTLDPTSMPNLEPVNEKATVTFELVSDEIDYNTGVSFETGNPANVSLIPGTYDVKVRGLYLDPVTFPPEQECAGGVVIKALDLFGGPDECNTIFEDEHSYTGMQWYGYEGQLKITPSDLEGENEIWIYILAPDVRNTPTEDLSYRDLQIIQNIPDWSMAYAQGPSGPHKLGLNFVPKIQ